MVAEKQRVRQTSSIVNPFNDHRLHSRVKTSAKFRSKRICKRPATRVYDFFKEVITTLSLTANAVIMRELRATETGQKFQDNIFT
jgi:hypothetical protein